MPKLHMIRVMHPTYGAIEVPAEDKLHAAYCAAKTWGLPWSRLAKEAEFERRGPYTPPRGKGG